MFVVPFPSSSFGVILHYVTLLMVPGVKRLRLATPLIVADAVPLLLVLGEYLSRGGGPFRAQI